MGEKICLLKLLCHKSTQTPHIFTGRFFPSLMSLLEWEVGTCHSLSVVELWSDPCLLSCANVNTVISLTRKLTLPVPPWHLTNVAIKCVSWQAPTRQDTDECTTIGSRWSCIHRIIGWPRIIRLCQGHRLCGFNKEFIFTPACHPCRGPGSQVHLNWKMWVQLTPANWGMLCDSIRFHQFASPA